MLFILVFSAFVYSGEANVTKVEFNKNKSNLYNFQVTVLHQDEGWDHYVNKWDIIDENNNVIATRILHHPHVTEQPFTRSLSGVKIPSNVKTITIRAYDKVHKYGGKTIKLKIK